MLILYRTGYGGDFLGVGGTWNLNEEKNADAEIVASGVFVGFMIYTSVQIITFFFGTTAHKRYNNMIRGLALVIFLTEKNCIDCL